LKWIKGGTFYRLFSATRACANEVVHQTQEKLIEINELVALIKEVLCALLEIHDEKSLSFLLVNRDFRRITLFGP